MMRLAAFLFLFLPPVSEQDKIETIVSGIKAQTTKFQEVTKDKNWTLRIFGENLLTIENLTLRSEDFKSTTVFIHKDEFASIDDRQIRSNVRMSTPGKYKLYFSTAIKRNQSLNDESNEIEVKVLESSLFMPLYATIPVVLVLVVLSGLFSGLNIGLIALDTKELELIIKASEKESERKYAAAILPVRKKGNYLLCSILVGNTLVNTAITLLVDNLMEYALPDSVGQVSTLVIATLIPTLTIVMLGEILPQSICTKYGLAVGARTIYLTYVVMFLTAPISFPVSKLLDCIVGKEESRQYGPRRLIKLVEMSMSSEHKGNDAEIQTMQIFKGATQLQRCTVGETMTPSNEMFMIEEHVILDAKRMERIQQSGYSRIPIYKQGNRDKIVHWLNIKDLTCVNPTANDDVETIIGRNPYHEPVRFALRNTLDRVLLEDFKQGFYHFVIVNDIVENEETGEIHQNTVGLVSLEDVIELILGNIKDEKDLKKEKQKQLMELEQEFSQVTKSSNVETQADKEISIWTWMTNNLPLFQGKELSKSVVRKLIHGVSEEECLLKRGKMSRNFFLLLEGRFRLELEGDEEVEWKVVQGLIQGFGTKKLHILAELIQDKQTPREKLEKEMSFIPSYTLKALEGSKYLTMNVDDYLELLQSSWSNSVQISRKKK